MQRAQHSKEKKNAASSALIEAEGRLELLRYTAPVGLIPHGLTWLLAEAPRRPTRERMPLLYLLYYHKADVTSQSFALCRQNDVLHDAYQFNGRESPKTDAPCIPPETGYGPEGPTYISLHARNTQP